MVRIRNAGGRGFAAACLALMTTATAVVAAPANDLCQNATPVLGENVATPYDTTGATNTPADVNPLNCLSAEDAARNDVWFSYTPGSTGFHYIFDTPVWAGLSSSLRVSVYSACGGTGNVLACGVGYAYGSLTAGQTVFIRVSGDSDTPVKGKIAVFPEYLPPSNDLCHSATPLQYDTPVSFTTGYATNTLVDVNPSCLSEDDNSRSDIWYSYTPNVTGTFPITVVRLGTSLYPKISAYTACGGTGQLLACLDGGDIGFNYVYTLNVPGTAGQTVYIRLGEGVNSYNQGTIQIGSSLPPYNDWCNNSAQSEQRIYAGVPEAFDTAYATFRFGDTFHTCLTPAQAVANDVWYYHQVNFSIPQGYFYSVTVTPASPGFVPNVTVLQGCPDNDKLLACAPANVGDITNGFGSRVLVPVFNDGNTNTYDVTIRVGGDDNTPGNGIIQVDGPFPAAPNDSCENAAGIADGETVSFFNDFATNSSFGSACPGSDLTADNNFDVWYRFVPNQNGQVTFSTCGSSARVHLSTYNDACNTQVGCGTTESCSVANGAFGTITVPATAGTAIRLRVASFHGQIGDVLLHAQFGPVSCPADFNGDHTRDVADLFGYINAWLAKNASADFNHDTHIDVADLFGFINAWLAGC